LLVWKGPVLSDAGPGHSSNVGEGYADALEGATQQAETALRVEPIQKAFQEGATGQ
jgi:hypothetical protein